MATKRDYYEVLGVEKGASKDEIKKGNFILSKMLIDKIKDTETMIDYFKDSDYICEAYISDINTYILEDGATSSIRQLIIPFLTLFFSLFVFRKQLKNKNIDKENQLFWNQESNVSRAESPQAYYLHSRRKCSLSV